MPQEQSIRSIPHVLEKLRAFTNGEDIIKQRAVGIKDLINTYDTRPRASWALQNRLTELIKTGRLPNHQEKDELENKLAAYLLSVNRKFIGPSFDEEKEQRQIDAIASFLSGCHVHLGTGEGKSSVVFPIVSIIESLCSENRQVILSTANDSLLQELQTNTQRFLDEMSSTGFIPAGSIDINEEQRGNLRRDENLRSVMVKEALTEGRYSEDTVTRIRNSFWEEEFGEQEEKKKPSSKHRISLMVERDLVFAYARDPKKFAKSAPTIYMDEAHVPYDRGTPYENTSDLLYFSPENAQSSTFEWLIDYVVSHSISENDFTVKNGVHQLKEAEAQKLGILLTNRLSHMQDTDRAIQNRIERAVNEGIGIASRSLELGPEESRIFGQRMRSFINETFGNKKPDPEKRYDLMGRIQAIGDRVTVFYNEFGSSYLFDDHGRLHVRDQYLGKLLEKHEFQPEAQLLLHAMNEKYAFVPLNKKASRMLHYHTFVRGVSDKLRCASGSLLYPNLLEKKIEQTDFAHFLENETKRNIIAITPPEFKDIPEPRYFASNGEAIDRLVEDQAEHGRKPTLIISWNEKEAQSIYERLQKTFGAERIHFLSSNPTKEEETQAHRRLADGEIDFIVSSGGSALGIDIKKSGQTEDPFPDLKVVLFNLPQSRMQVAQALNRRRKEGDDFAWYINTDKLEELVTMYDERKNPIYRWLGGIDAETIRKEFARSDNPRKKLELVMDMIRKKEARQHPDSAFVLKMDEFMESIAIRQFREAMREKVEQKYAYSDRLNTPYQDRWGVASRILESRAPNYGQIRNDLLAAQPRMSEQGVAGRPETLQTSILLALAQQRTRQSRAKLVETEHLLYALLSDSQIKGILEKNGISVQHLRSIIDEKTPKQDTEEKSPIFSLRVAHIYQQAYKMAQKQGRLVAPEHLLLALLDEALSITKDRSEKLQQLHDFFGIPAEIYEQVATDAQTARMQASGLNDLFQNRLPQRLYTERGFPQSPTNEWVKTQQKEVEELFDIAWSHGDVVNIQSITFREITNFQEGNVPHVSAADTVLDTFDFNRPPLVTSLNIQSPTLTINGQQRGIIISNIMVFRDPNTSKIYAAVGKNDEGNDILLYYDVFFPPWITNYQIIPFSGSEKNRAMLFTLKK